MSLATNSPSKTIRTLVLSMSFLRQVQMIWETYQFIYSITLVDYATGWLKMIKEIVQYNGADKNLLFNQVNILYIIYARMSLSLSSFEQEFKPFSFPKEKEKKN